MPGTRAALADRLNRSVDRYCPALPNRGKIGSCWLWAGHIREDGYAKIRLGGKNDGDDYVHRVSYGAVPEGLELDHLCRVRHCVNPDHLEAVPRKINAERRRSLVCGKRLHFMFGRNLAVHGKSRGCRACKAEAGRARYRRVR